MKNVLVTTITAFSILLFPYFTYSQQVDAPVYKDGEWWVFQIRLGNEPFFEYQVTFKDGKFDSTRRVGLAFDDSPPVHLNDADKKMFDFPLVKGKKWSYRFKWESRTSGREFWRNVDAEVIGPVTDPLKTAAGKFEVIEIRRTDTVSFPDREAEYKFTYFYSAETKSIVKLVSDWETRGGSPRHKEFELIKYSVSE